MDARHAALESFRESLERCLADATFTQRFYARFLLASEEAASKFAQVDLKRQSNVLRSSLYLVLRAALGHPDGVEHLEDLGRSHARTRHDIDPHLYVHWLDSLIAAASETDPRFSPAVEKAWRAALEPCIERMTRHY